MQSSKAHVVAQWPTLPRSHKHKGAVSRRCLSSSKGPENDCCLRASDCLRRDAADAVEATDTVEAADAEDAAGAVDAEDPGVLTLLFQVVHQSQPTV